MSEAVVWANLDFEYELSQGTGYRPSPQLQKLCRRWQGVLRVLPGCRDAALYPESGKAFIPWGITPRVEEFVAPGTFPTSELVKTINDKRFSHALEVEFGCALKQARVIESLEELEGAVRTCPHDWVLKHPLGVGGRERVTGKSGKGFPEAHRWAESRFQAGWSLVFEPWAYQREELSFHYQIERTGDADFLGHCRLMSDESGAFRGNRVLPDERPKKSFRAITDKVVERLSKLGYWGPVSIDAFTGRLGETQVVRPLVEINARYSFGRLALESVRYIPEGWCLQWWHPKARQRTETEKIANDYPVDLDSFHPGIFRLPIFADPNGISGSYLVVAPSADKWKAPLSGCPFSSYEVGKV